MSLRSSRKTGKLQKNRPKSVISRSSTISLYSTVNTPPLTPPSDASTSISDVGVASGSGTGEWGKRLHNRTLSIQSYQTSTLSQQIPNAPTRLDGCRTSSGLVYASFCDSPFFCLLIYYSSPLRGRKPINKDRNKKCVGSSR